MNLRMDSTPILLGSPLLTIAQNTGVSPDSEDIGLAFRKPMWIDEVRFLCRSPENVLATMGSYIRCKMNLGRIALTGTRDGGNFVPLWSFVTKNQQLDLESQVSDIAPVNTNNFVWSSFRWLLPKPLYVPAGQVLASTFFRTNDGLGAGLNGNDAQVAVAYAGRTVAPGTPFPAKIAVPYVALYEPPSGAASAISSELDLVNPFLVPLHVQRFTMRVLDTNDGGNPIRLENQFSGANRVITMKDSSGYDIVTDATSLLEIAFAGRRAWTFNRTLQPKERFVVNYTNNVTAEVVSPSIAMIGWREEVFK